MPSFENGSIGVEKGRKSIVDVTGNESMCGLAPLRGLINAFRVSLQAESMGTACPPTAPALSLGKSGCGGQ